MPMTPSGELEQLAGHRAVEAVDAGDAVADGEDGAGLGDVDLLVVVLDLLADDPADLFGADVHCDSVSGGDPKVVLPLQGAAQVLELGADGAVEDDAAHLGDDAAEDGGVDGALDDDLLLRGRRELLGEAWTAASSSGTALVTLARSRPSSTSASSR